MRAPQVKHAQTYVLPLVEDLKDYASYNLYYISYMIFESDSKDDEHACEDPDPILEWAQSTRDNFKGEF